MKSKSHNSILRRTLSGLRSFGRATMAQIEKLTGGSGGYEAGKSNRVAGRMPGSKQNENSVDRANVANLRRRSRQLYMDNPHARKLCRTLEAKVIGCNSRPQSQATTHDGKPHLAYRKRADELWDAISQEIDYRGKPGAGGQSMADLMKSALRATILDGEVLCRFRTAGLRGLDERQRMSERMPDFRIQLIHAERLDDSVTDDRTFAGIELDANDRRVAYRIFDRHPADPRGADSSKVSRISAREILHIYISDDVDQFRGTPWFSSAILTMRDLGDYRYNELIAAAMSACVVLSYKLGDGQTGVGLESPTSDDLVDADGNTQTHMQPGMMINGEINGFDPSRPNANLVTYSDHMIHEVAASVPGTKGSTLTGNYKGASFSSERAADNDIWPELECTQHWFHGSFSQPIYEAIVIAAVESGWFDGIENFDETEFVNRQRNYLSTQWQGPVARSINPKDDALAGRERVRNFTSSPQREAAKINANWRELIGEYAEFITECESKNIPQGIIAQGLGIDQNNSGKNALDDSEPNDGNEAEETSETAEAAIAA